MFLSPAVCVLVLFLEAALAAVNSRCIHNFWDLSEGERRAEIEKHLREMYREALSLDAADDILWDRVEVHGWPEAVQTFDSSKWTVANLFLIYKALPSLVVLPSRRQSNQALVAFPSQQQSNQTCKSATSVQQVQPSFSSMPNDFQTNDSSSTAMAVKAPQKRKRKRSNVFGPRLYEVTLPFWTSDALISKWHGLLQENARNLDASAADVAAPEGGLSGADADDSEAGCFSFDDAGDADDESVDDGLYDALASQFGNKKDDSIDGYFTFDDFPSAASWIDTNIVSAQTLDTLATDANEVAAESKSASASAAENCMEAGVNNACSPTAESLLTINLNDPDIKRFKHLQNYHQSTNSNSIVKYEELPSFQERKEFVLFHLFKMCQRACPQTSYKKKLIRWSDVEIHGWPSNVPFCRPSVWGSKAVYDIYRCLPQMSMTRFFPSHSATSTTLHYPDLESKMKAKFKMHKRINDIARFLGYLRDARIDWEDLGSAVGGICLTDSNWRSWTRSDLHKLQTKIVDKYPRLLAAKGIAAAADYANSQRLEISAEGTMKRKSNTALESEHFIQLPLVASSTQSHKSK